MVVAKGSVEDGDIVDSLVELQFCITHLAYY